MLFNVTLHTTIIAGGTICMVYAQIPVGQRRLVVKPVNSAPPCMNFISGECTDDDCTLNHDPQFKVAVLSVPIQSRLVVVPEPARLHV